MKRAFPSPVLVMTARYLPGIIMSVSMFDKWSGAAIPSKVLRPESEGDDIVEAGSGSDGCGARGFISTEEESGTSRMGTAVASSLSTNVGG